MNQSELKSQARPQSMPQLLAVSGSIERLPKPSLARFFLRFFSKAQSDLTLESWSEIERKRSLYMASHK